MDEHYVNSHNIYVCLHQYELSHFQHVYNILAFKFKLSLFCNYVMFIFMDVSIIMSTLCIYEFFSEGPMADERMLNGSPSMNEENYYDNEVYGVAKIVALLYSTKWLVVFRSQATRIRRVWSSCIIFIIRCAQIVNATLIWQTK